MSVATNDPNTRCRLVLVADPRTLPSGALDEALAGGDVASVIFDGADIGAGADRSDALGEPGELGELVAVAQGFGAAALVAGDARLAEESGADGVHLPFGSTSLARSPDRVVGVSTQARHAALEAGEAGVDYVLFGRLDRDTHPEPHPKWLDLARWWSALVTVPCVVPGGTDLASVVAVAEAGADFVALRSAIFGADRPGEAVRRANALLDERAPRFGG